MNILLFKLSLGQTQSTKSPPANNNGKRKRTYNTICIPSSLNVLCCYFWFCFLAVFSTVSYSRQVTDNAVIKCLPSVIFLVKRSLPVSCAGALPSCKEYNGSSIHDLSFHFYCTRIDETTFQAFFVCFCSQGCVHVRGR